MAEMLSIQESVGKYLEKTSRHQRMCHKVAGAQKYAEAINSDYKGLVEKNTMYREAKYEKFHAYDLMILNNNNMDDGVRTVFEKCSQYDRENPADLVLHLIFPDGTFGKFVRNNIFKESVIVEQLVVRLESLGKDHSLASVSNILKKSLREMGKSILAYHEAVRHEKIAKTELELSKDRLRKQYEANYLDARKELGRKVASQLFPTKISYKKVEKELGTVDTESSQAA